MTPSKPRICFVSPTMWPVFSRAPGLDVVGGAEVQQAILARQFARAGYAVSLVCMDHGQPDGVVIDGVTVYRAYAPGAGLPVLRFLHPRLSALWAALRRADADIYYQRGAGMLTGVVARFCRRHGRRFIFAAASDLDFDPALPLIQYGRDRALFRHGVRRAHAVVVQNLRQQHACRATYGLPSTLVNSCHVAGDGAPADGSGAVLWVGSIKPLKRPELFLELARSLPQLRFRMVGGGKGTPCYAAIEQAAAALPNLELVGFVPHHQIQPYFDAARLLVSTSEWEGFPNTFLQAWSQAVPTVSYFDTGSAVDGAPVVTVVASAAQMREQVARLAGDDAAWRAAGQRCLACYRAGHTPAMAVAAYEQVIAALAAPAAAAPGVDPRTHNV
ncbi:MAG: glycosyltransferase family 4 protein [Pseudomonadota bacterium]